MRSLLPRSLLVAVLALPAVASDARAFLGHNRVETVYVSPTESILTVPTSYVVPSSYVLPTSYSYVLPTSTSYVVPSAYVVPRVYSATSYVLPSYSLSSTSYLLPSSYLATSYTVPARRLLGRRSLLATSSYVYYPTTYYYPTTLTYPLVTTSAAYPSSLDCDPVAAPAVPTAPASGTNGKSASPSGGERPSVIDSVPRNEPGLSSGATSPPTAETISPSPPPAATETPQPSTGSGANPPPPAAPVPAPADELPATPSGGTPAAPTTGTSPGTDGVRHEVQRPKSQSNAAEAMLPPALPSRSILEGRVVAAESGQVEQGVRVIVKDLMKRFTDRTATTDALGRYAVNLPDGDWEVFVQAPSRKTFAVSRITVSGGQITDDSGRAVGSVLIKR